MRQVGDCSSAMTTSDPERIKVSFVIPAYNAADTIGTAIQSVLLPKKEIPCGWQLEVIVVDDGSVDSGAITHCRWDAVRVLRHLENRGKCAAINTGIGASTGDVVIILDADDEMVDEWPAEFVHVLREWPPEVQVCYGLCRNDRGDLTATYPGYSGLLTADDFINERYAGEYLPCFRGEYIRQRGYVDLGLLKRPCLVVSYLTLVGEGSFWISSKVLRKYHDRRPGSITSNFADMRKAEDMVRCYEVLLAGFGDLYESRAPMVYQQKLLRQAVYLSLARRRGAWRSWLRGADLLCPLDTVGALLVLMLGRRFCLLAVQAAKRMGLIRPYG